MAATIEELERDINDAISIGFRGQLLNRGLSRSMVWENGILPLDAPQYSDELTYGLLSFGYSLLNMGLRLRRLGGNLEICRSAFEKAALAIEVVVMNGRQDEIDRGFHNVLISSAYHLGGYSAKAFSLLQGKIQDKNLSPIETTLCQLILRDFDELNSAILEWKISGYGSDENLANLLESKIDEYGDEVDDVLESGIDFIEVPSIDIAITDNYFSAISLYLMALQYGDRQYVEQALVILNTNIEVCRELNLVPQWWIHNITIYLLDDLWFSSFHEVIPRLPLNGEEEEWSAIRWNFISLLFSRKRAEIELWPSQLEGATRAVNESDDLVISLPTSAGKTRIAEICILRCLSLGKRIFFITPLRALCAQTEIGLRRTFSPLGKSVSTLYGSIGTSDFERDALKTRNIVVGTPEKLDFALRSDPTILDDVGLIVLDEGHMIGLSEREIRYEIQIQRLLKRNDSDSRRIVCLSAILPDNDQLEDFVAWLRSDEEGTAVKNEWRPTDLRFGEVLWNGNHAQLNFRIEDESPFVPNFIVARVPPIGRRRIPFPRDAAELNLATAWRLIRDRHSVLIYCPLKKTVTSLASKIVDLIERGALESVLSVPRSELNTAMMLGEEWLGKDHPVLKCLENGVAIHHASLPGSFRKEIERLLRENILKITVSSPTLAQGLNLSATAVIIYSLNRGKEPISTSEFRNVIGRAGRAFIDSNGLVLYPIYDCHIWRLNRWRELIQDTSARNMESGLFRLVTILIVRISKKLNTKSSNDVFEYILNNLACWDFPDVDGETDEERNEQEQSWRSYITYLDTAILSLIGEDNCDIEELAGQLDKILESSFWKRRISRKNKELQKLLSQVLVSRSAFIWNNSTVTQRRGYFLAGVGFESGRQMDEVAHVANDLLISANAEILDGNTDNAIRLIVELAELIFQIPPFNPGELQHDWKEILETWLKGKSMTTIEEQDSTLVLEFIEGAIVYRLSWGMEAIRVRAEANQDEILENTTIDDYETGLVVPCVENGTLNRSAALLMQAGFTSRLAAIKAVLDTNADFTNMNKLSNWLNNEQTLELTRTNDWPTPETSSMWKIFVNDFLLSADKVWKYQVQEIEMEWNDPNLALSSDTAVKLYNQTEKETHVLTERSEPIGRLSEPIVMEDDGIYYATVSDTKNCLNVGYFGSGNQPFNSF